MSATDAGRCRVCDATGMHRHHLAKEMMFGRLDAFDYFQCRACGCLQITSTPPNLANYYGPAYYSFDADLDGEFSDPTHRAARARRVRALLTWPRVVARRLSHTDMRRPLWSLRKLRLRRGDRILDVGCGSGRLLYQLREAGWQNVLGVDAFIPRERYYANGLVVRRRQLDEVEGTWDVIMFHHVFEHLLDPVATLAQVAAKLSPAGTCLIRLPLADSEAFERYGTDWVQLDAPRHICLHTRKSLTEAAERSGLRIVDVRCDSYELQFWGSEQYRRGIPLLSDGSYRWGQGARIFSPEEMDAWRREADLLNRRGRGDQACFYLRHAKRSTRAPSTVPDRAGPAPVSASASGSNDG